MNVYVSLTTIQQNGIRLFKTLQSMEKQTRKPDQIFLYISKEPNLLDEGIPSEEALHPEVQNLLKKYPRWIQLRYCKNTGPYRKLLPLLKEKIDAKEMNCCIITIDDDTVYHPSLIEHMIQDYQTHNCCITYRGFTFRQPITLDMLTYEDQEPKRIPKHLYNFHTGKGGVLFTPSMFTKTGDLLWDEDVYMIHCPTNDNIWFNFIRIANDVPCYIGNHSYMVEDLTNHTRSLYTIYNNVDKNNTKQIRSLVKYLCSQMYLTHTFDSTIYWEERYKNGGNSGAGSYGPVVTFKGNIINHFIKQLNIQSMIDYGVGDGNQLKYIKTPPTYIGIDTSPTCIETCKKVFYYDIGKTFYTIDEYDRVHTDTTYDLAMSCDVLYCLIKDQVYVDYINRLFSLSTKYVLIYSVDKDINHTTHVKSRAFTSYIRDTFPEWKLMRVVQNPHKIYNEFPSPNFYLYQYVGPTKSILNTWYDYIEKNLMPIVGTTHLEGNIYGGTRTSKKTSEHMIPKQYNISLCLQRMTSTHKPLRILEVGFNAGFSALLMYLSTSQPIDFTAVDINLHPYVKPCFERMKKDYPDIKIYLENSHTKLPKLVAEKKQYDLIHIDGDHSLEGARKDMEDCLRLSHRGTIIIFDDTNVDYLHDLCVSYIEKKRVKSITHLFIECKERKHQILEVL